MPGDEVNVALNLQRDVTNYSFSSYIYQTSTYGTASGMSSGIGTIGATVVAPTIGVVSASTGSLVLGLTEAQTTLISPTGSYRWYLRWVGPGVVTRTIVSGSVTGVAP